MTGRVDVDSRGMPAARADAELEFLVKPFDELTPRELHDLLRLRTDVFVVEQQCAYPELDGKDPDAIHLLGYREQRLVAYARWYSKAESFVLGRIVVAPDERHSGIGRELVLRALEAIGDEPVTICAQTYLESFYGRLGFETTSEPYDDYGIPHVDMVRPKANGSSC